MVITRSEWALDLGGAKGSRTPDLLHAMQQGQRYGLGLDGVYLDLQCTGVPASACQPVRVGCPLGCPLVVALSVFEPFVVGLRRGGTDTLAE